MLAIFQRRNSHALETDRQNFAHKHLSEYISKCRQMNHKRFYFFLEKKYIEVVHARIEMCCGST